MTKTSRATSKENMGDPTTVGSIRVDGRAVNFDGQLKGTGGDRGQQGLESSKLGLMEKFRSPKLGS